MSLPQASSSHREPAAPTRPNSPPTTSLSNPARSSDSQGVFRRVLSSPEICFSLSLLVSPTKSRPELLQLDFPTAQKQPRRPTVASSGDLFPELVIFPLCRTLQQQVAASILSPANCLTTVAWRFPASFHLNSPLISGFDYLSVSFSLGFICTAIPVRSGGKWWLKFRWGLDEGGGRETGGGGLRVEEGARFRFRRHMKMQGGIRVLKPVALN